MKLTEDSIKEFENKLYLNEKSKATVMKYSAAIHKLKNYLKENEISPLKFHHLPRGVIGCY